MPRSAVAVGLGVVGFGAWISAGCSSSDHPGALESAGTSAQLPGTSAGAGNGNGSFNFGGGNGQGDGNGNTGGLGAACAAVVSKAEPVPLDMYLMLDSSGSMLDLTAGGASKWDAVKTALRSFLNDPASAGLGVGLQYFPLTKPNAPASCASNAECGDSGPCLLKFCYNLPANGLLPCQVAADCVNPNNGADYGPCTQLAQCSNDQSYVCRTPGRACVGPDPAVDLGTCTPITRSVCEHTSSCDPGVYGTPAGAIAALPGSGTNLIASIDAREPAGNTPTGPALSGAIQQASAWAKAHPGHRVVTVLATDGLPTECAPTEIASVAALARAGVAASPSINTFVIGVFGPDDVASGAPDNLNRIAQQGGTTSAFIVDTRQDVTAQFLGALDQIRGAHLACEFQIPQPSDNQSLNYLRVNVQLTDNGKKTDVLFVRQASGCDRALGGWYYDVDPASGLAAPSRIITCPSTCASFQAAAQGASVGIALGCETIVK